MPTHIPLYQVDAFTSRLFAGNPAAVCPLDAWLPDGVMQAIAAENNLSETAFFVPAADGYDLRWFTPVTEVDLCGHATLASAHVVFTQLRPQVTTVRFHTRSGVLPVRRESGRIVLDFPSLPAAACDPPPDLAPALGAEPAQTLAMPASYLAVFDREAQIRVLAPDFSRLAALGPTVIATAPGTNVDFVSRFFAPAKGIPEDPVTGSAHCTLVPYWSARLGKTALVARQLSPRGGELFCEDRGARIAIAGHAVLYLKGDILV